MNVKRASDEILGGDYLKDGLSTEISEKKLE